MLGRISAMGERVIAADGTVQFTRAQIQGITTVPQTEDATGLENACGHCGAAEALDNSDVCGACERAIQGDAQGAMMDTGVEH